MAELAEEHVTGVITSYGEEGAAPWRDVGIWTEAQWAFLMAKCLGSMREYSVCLRSCSLIYLSDSWLDVPIGATKVCSLNMSKACRFADFSRVRAQRQGKPTSWSRRAQYDLRNLSIKCVSHITIPSQNYTIDFF